MHVFHKTQDCLEPMCHNVSIYTSHQIILEISLKVLFLILYHQIPSNFFLIQFLQIFAVDFCPIGQVSIMICRFYFHKVETNLYFQLVQNQIRFFLEFTHRHNKYFLLSFIGCLIF